MIKLITPILLLLSIMVSSAQCKDAKWDDFSQKQITEFLSPKLDSNTVALRIKGLVCESCGIGLRKKFAKLKAVDKKRYNKGVGMDPYKMLLYVALDEGASLSVEEINKAIEAAGYEGVYLYEKKGSKITSTNL